ncbi:MAG TPA: hypothetical protein VD884_04335 [Ohtaekwangia sp.]|nr:hypothetical protein [Ohtaekwangia sp.]
MLFLIYGVLCTGVQSAYAQEVGSPSFEAYDMEPGRERLLLTAGETLTDPAKPTAEDKPAIKTTSKDSLNKLPPVKAEMEKTEASKPESKPQETDDSILSFNFLYYLIEKYKLQDIID